MSVLIKGMDMPKLGCASCDILHNVVGCYYCSLVNDYVEQNVESENRHLNCPLAEVPTPHGNLIDREEFHGQMYEASFIHDTDEQRWDSGNWIRYRLYERIMRNQPIIIESEE